MNAANFLLGLAAIMAVTTTVVSCAAVFWATRRRRAANCPDFTPPITIFKPLKGIDEGLEENLRTFFLLDYPKYQLLFGVAEANDPAIGVVQRLLAEFPNQDATLVVGARAFGLNPKVENLAALAPYRRHDVILISDSNVRVHPPYLRETACYLGEPGVGLVTNLFAGIGECHFGAALENLQLNGFIAGGVALAASCGATCVVGKSMLMPMRVLDEIGGFAGVRNLLAEDQVIGVRVRKAGYKIRLSHHVIGNVNQNRDLRWFLNRHSRWYKIRRRMALPAFLLEPATNLGALGLIWALSGDSGLAWGGLVVLSGVGMARDALQTRLLRGSWPRLRHLPLSLVKDLFLLPLWFDALVNVRLQWRGHRLLIGRYTRLRGARVPRSVRRRVRRVRRLRAKQRHSAGRAIPSQPRANRS
jgi:ceramide glucosyltransferase